jgi:hypothetical protein
MRQGENRGHQPLCWSQSWGWVRTSTNRDSWRAKQKSQILRRSSIMSLGKRVNWVNGLPIWLGGSGFVDGIWDFWEVSSIDVSILMKW